MVSGGQEFGKGPRMLARGLPRHCGQTVAGAGTGVGAGQAVGSSYVLRACPVGGLGFLTTRWPQGSGAAHLAVQGSDANGLVSKTEAT